MDKSYYFRIIFDNLIVSDGMDFQRKAGIILRQYYKYKGLNFIMPEPLGGDDKNDGWVQEQDIYYQMYAPIKITDSIKNDILVKFKNDLEGLIKKVYVDKVWGKEINEFVFIVNLRKHGLPPHTEQDAVLIKGALEKQYSVKIKEMTITTSDYFSTIISEMLDDDKAWTYLNNICRELDVIPIDCKKGITNNQLDKYFSDIRNYRSSFAAIFEGSDYKRISSDEKININDLDNVKDRILKTIPYLAPFDSYIKQRSGNLERLNNFREAQNFVVNKYRELARLGIGGTTLYHRLVKEVEAATSVSDNNDISEMFVIYVFDRCDIFKKE